MSDKYEKYRLLAYQVPPIRQSTPTTCWAACIAWWAKATGGGRPQMTQEQAYFKYAHLSDEDNRMSRANLAQILNDPIWKATAELITGPRDLGKNYFLRRLESGPMIIGYRDALYGDGHVNVGIAPSISHPDDMIVMEPWTGMTTHKGYGKYTSLSSKLVIAWPRG
ncbi:MAG TPA: hypothetical protein DEO88_18225 [Syntrophobacteraceae bacterium]|nr:hypothetical protein [Syntrophobacteraceae bacterium]